MASAIPVVGPALSVAMAGVSGLGGKMQSSLQNGDSYYKAFGKGLVSGGVDAALMYGFNKLGKIASSGKGMKTVDNTVRSLPQAMYHFYQVPLMKALQFYIIAFQN